MNPSEKALYQAASEARKTSYSPYSEVQVGAAIRLTNGRIFSGCNVENSSYGGTVCAERVAIFKAVSETNTEGSPKPQIEAVMVVTDASPPWPPCGLCRQIIAEFAQNSTPVITANLKGEVNTYTFKELFPDSFNPSHLLGRKR